MLHAFGLLLGHHCRPALCFYSGRLVSFSNFVCRHHHAWLRWLGRAARSINCLPDDAVGWMLCCTAATPNLVVVGVVGQAGRGATRFAPLLVSNSIYVYVPSMSIMYCAPVQYTGMLGCCRCMAVHACRFSHMALLINIMIGIGMAAPCSPARGAPRAVWLLYLFVLCLLAHECTVYNCSHSAATLFVTFA